MAPKGESKLSWWGFVLFCPKEPKNGQKSPGKFCHWIFNPGNKWSQKSWNFLPSKEKILEFSQKKFLEFHEKLVFLEFSGPRIFHPGIFCLEIFCPGILFPGKFWHSDSANNWEKATSYYVIEEAILILKKILLFFSNPEGSWVRHKSATAAL